MNPLSDDTLGMTTVAGIIPSSGSSSNTSGGNPLGDNSSGIGGTSIGVRPDGTDSVNDHVSGNSNEGGTISADPTRVTSSGSTGSSNNTRDVSVDTLDRNTGVTIYSCDIENICIPKINVPNDLINLGSETEESKKKREQFTADVNDIADRVSKLVDAALTVPANPFPHEHYHSEFQQPELAEYVEEINKAIPDKLENYDNLSEFLNTDFPQHNFDDIDINDDLSLKNMLDKLDDLLKEPVDIDTDVSEVKNSTLTERVVDGQGTFDWIASAMLNQLDVARKRELIDKSELAQVYTQSMINVLQTSSQFVLERDKSYWANLLVRSQVIQANIQSLLAKAQLITYPIEVKLKYAQLHTQLQQMKLLKYQAETEKVHIKQIEAQTDQILVQTDGMRITNELSQTQLQDAKLKLAITQEQVKTVGLQNEELQVRIQDAKVKLNLSQEQVVQTREQTKQLVAQTEQTVESTKLINSQWQKTLKEVKLVEANILEIEAKIKLMSQQTEKELNQIDLLKGQVAEAYTRISLLGEQIKAAKAQYSDTIDGKPVKGIIGTQNALHRKQSMSYDRDSLYKVMQLQAQGWQVKKTADIGTKSPVAFTSAAVDGMLEQYLGTYYMDGNSYANSLTRGRHFNATGSGSKEVSGRVDINNLIPVSNFLDYVSDPEMDGNFDTTVGNTGKNPKVNNNN